MAGTRADVLLNTMMVVDIYTLRRALTGLTQEEADWEPHPGAWGIRRRVGCATPNPHGDPSGAWVADNDWSIVEAAAAHDGTVEPMATIGWLLNHIGAAPGALAAMEILGGPNTTTPEAYRRMWFSEILPTVDEQVARLRSGWAALDRVLRCTTDEVLERTYEGHPWKRGDLAVTALLNEVSHHGAQICALRDLYAHQRGREVVERET